MKRNLIFKFSLLIFIISIAVNFVSFRMQLTEKQEKLEALKQKIIEQGIENEALEKLCEDGLDKEYIIKIARELGYVTPDERVYIDVADGE